MPLLKCLLALGLALLLGGCGGSTGFVPFISAAKPELLQYGRTATILLGGRHLRTFLVVESPGCANPVFTSRSTPELLVLKPRAAAGWTQASVATSSILGAMERTIFWMP